MPAICKSHCELSEVSICAELDGVNPFQTTVEFPRCFGRCRRFDTADDDGVWTLRGSS